MNIPVNVSPVMYYLYCIMITIMFIYPRFIHLISRGICMRFEKTNLNSDEDVEFLFSGILKSSFSGENLNQ